MGRKDTTKGRFRFSLFTVAFRGRTDVECRLSKKDKQHEKQDSNGGTSIEWLDTIDNILELDFDTVIPGHGGLMTKDDVREFRGKIEPLQQRGRELISQGVSKEQFGSRLNADDIGWQIEGSLFGRASLSGFYDELRGN